MSPSKPSKEQLQPEPFTDDDIKDKFWKPEPFDDCLPQPGWITDLVYSARGIETPTSFTLWAGIWAVSSVLRRDVWHQFIPLPKLYPNIYCILAGPPRVLGKSTILGICVRVMEMSNGMIGEQRWREWKKPNIVYSRSTGEALISQSLNPQKHPGYQDESTKVFEQFEGRSQCSIYASDLPTFLGKQKYNATLVNQLIDLYDCKDKDAMNTVARGEQPLFRIYVTLAGAATYEQLAKSMPVSAFGDGFLSRCIVIARSTPTRIFAKPRPVEGAPGEEQLAARLAWIQENARGQYVMSKQADQLYQELYLADRTDLLKHLDDDRYAIRFRYDMNLLKLAMIFRASRYEEGREIAARDIRDADRILDRTLRTSQEPLSGIGDDITNVVRAKLEQRIEANGQYPRLKVLKGLSRDPIHADQVSRILKDMREEGVITVWRPDTPGGLLKKRENVSSSIREVYRWVNGAAAGSSSRRKSVELPRDTSPVSE